MKQFILLILFASALFAGGDIRPTKSNISTANDKVRGLSKQKIAVGYVKPKCEDCGEPAELLPYNGEDLPIAETFPCPPEEENLCDHHMA